MDLQNVLRTMYSTALFANNIQSLNFLSSHYLTHLNYTSIELKEILFKLLNSSTSSKTFPIFLKSFKSEIKINEPLKGNQRAAFPCAINKKNNELFLKTILEIFSDSIEFTLSETDILEKESLLIWAAKENHQELLKLLLLAPKINMNAININRNFFGSKGDTILTWACNRGDFQIIKNLDVRFHETLDLNICNGLNENAIILLAKKGLYNILDWLIPRFIGRININIVNSNGESAWFKAIEGGYFNICEMIYDYFGNTLEIFPKNNFQNIYEKLLAKTLIKSVYFLTQFLKKNNLLSLIHKELLEKSLVQSIRVNSLELVEHFLENFGSSIDFSYKDESKRNIISFVSEYGSVKILSSLLNFNKICINLINDADNFGDNSLTWAIRSGNYDIYFYLISNFQQEFPEKEINYNNSLFLLTQKAQWELVEDLLLKQVVKIDTNVNNENKNNLLHYLSKSNQVSIFNYLIKNYPDEIKTLLQFQNQELETPLSVAARYKNWDILKEIVKYPIYNINSKDSSKRTFFSYVCSSQEIELIDELLEKHDNIDHNYVIFDVIDDDLWNVFLKIKEKRTIDWVYDINNEDTLISWITKNLNKNLKYFENIITEKDFKQKIINNFALILKNLIQQNCPRNLFEIFMENSQYYIIDRKNLYSLLENLAKNEINEEIFGFYFTKLLFIVENPSPINLFQSFHIGMEEKLLNRLIKMDENGIILNFTTKFYEQQTLFDIIIFNNYELIAKFAIEYSINKKVYFSNFEQTLFKAIKNNRFSIFKIFTEYKYWDLSSIDNETKNFIGSLILKKQVDIIDFLVEKFRFYQYFIENNTHKLAVCAAEINDLNFIDFLIKNNKLKTFQMNDHGKTFFFHLLINGCYDFIEKLVNENNIQNFPEFINCQDPKTKLTPIQYIFKEKGNEQLEKFINFTSKFHENHIPIIDFSSIKSFIDLKHENNLERLRILGLSEIRPKLIENDEIKKVLTNSESTQLSRVDLTIKVSIGQLKAKFDLTEQLIIEENVKIESFFEFITKLLNNEYPKEPLNEKIIKYLNEAMYSIQRVRLKTKVPSDLKIFVDLAYNQYKKMYNNKEYRHNSALIGYSELLALIWKAIEDLEDLNLKTESDKLEVVIDRQMNFVRHLVEAVNDQICCRGQFNKTLETLNFCHCLVKIDMIEFSNLNYVCKEGIMNNWKKIMKASWKNLNEQMKKKLKNQCFLWKELDIFERQAILGSWKLGFKEEFKECFSGVLLGIPHKEDYILLEDFLGYSDKYGMIDYSYINE